MISLVKKIDENCIDMTDFDYNDMIGFDAMLSYYNASSIKVTKRGMSLSDQLSNYKFEVVDVDILLSMKFSLPLTSLKIKTNENKLIYENSSSDSSFIVGLDIHPCLGNMRRKEALIVNFVPVLRNIPVFFCYTGMILNSDNRSEILSISDCITKTIFKISKYSSKNIIYTDDEIFIS